MPVTIVSSPDPHALTLGGRMRYQFSGSSRYLTAGVQATALLFVSAAVPNNTQISLKWNGQTHTLVFKTSPSAKNEFTAGNGSSDYVTALLEELQSYYPLREDFVLTAGPSNQLPGIVLTAKKPGPAYDITFTGAVGTPFGFGTTLAGADPIPKIQYSVYAELWLQKPGTAGTDLTADYERVFAPTIEFDSDSNATFDVGKVLHDHLQADLPLWSGASARVSVLSARKYYLVCGEAWGSPIEVGRLQTLPTRHAYLGGSDYVHRAGGGVNLLAGQTAEPGEDKALRMGGLVRVVRPDEPQFITFLNSRADRTDTALLLTRVFDDDSIEVKTALLNQTHDVALGEKITFAVGAAQQDLFSNLPQGRSLKEYKVQWIQDPQALTPLSAEYRYILNYDYQRFTRYFAYLNSYGAIDTLATFGKGTTELTRFYEQAERYLPANYELEDGQFVDYAISLQRSVEVTTGFRSQAELRAWDDFYRSPLRWRLVNNQALPIGITSKSIKEQKDDATQFAHRFEYQYLYKNDFYAEGETAGSESLLPPGFVGGGGTIVVPQPTTLYAVDNTVPNAVRELTADDIQKFREVAERPNPASLGFLSEQNASLVFRRSDQGVPYSDLTDKPTTRDQAGLTDVPTVADLFKTIFVKPHLSSWTGNQIPPEII